MTVPNLWRSTSLPGSPNTWNGCSRRAANERLLLVAGTPQPPAHGDGRSTNDCTFRAHGPVGNTSWTGVHRSIMGPVPLNRPGPKREVGAIDSCLGTRSHRISWSVQARASSERETGRFSPGCLQPKEGAPCVHRGKQRMTCSPPLLAKRGRHSSRVRFSLSFELLAAEKRRV